MQLKFFEETLDRASLFIDVKHRAKLSMHALLVPHNAREYHAMVTTPKEMEESVIGKVVLAISLMK